MLFFFNHFHTHIHMAIWPFFSKKKKKRIFLKLSNVTWSSTFSWSPIKMYLPFQNTKTEKKKKIVTTNYPSCTSAYRNICIYLTLRDKITFLFNSRRRWRKKNPTEKLNSIFSLKSLHSLLFFCYFLYIHRFHFFVNLPFKTCLL